MFKKIANWFKKVFGKKEKKVKATCNCVNKIKTHKEVFTVFDGIDVSDEFVIEHFKDVFKEYLEIKIEKREKDDCQIYEATVDIVVNNDKNCL